MTERPNRPNEKQADRNANEPKVQDISKLVDHSTITLQDLDQRMQNMRASLSQLLAQASLLQGTGGTPTGLPTQSPMTPQQAWGQDPYNLYARSQPQAFAPPYGVPPTSQAFGQPFSQPFGQPFGHTFGGGQPGGSFAPQADRGISPIGSPSLQPGGIGETRTTRDLKDIPPQTKQPASDVVDDGNNFQIRLEMPGVKKEDMDIMVTDRAVLVTALARLDLDDGVVVVQERGPVVYRRTIQLPGEIKTSECQAKLKDGVLRLSIPKKNPTDSPRHLEIAYG